MSVNGLRHFLDLAEIPAQELRAMVEASTLHESDRQRKVTVSVGAAVAQLNESPSELVKRADEMLYLAKNSGRNCACF